MFRVRGAIEMKSFLAVRLVGKFDILGSTCGKMLFFDFLSLSTFLDGICFSFC